MPGCKNELSWAVALAALVGTADVACNGRDAHSMVAEDDDGGLDLAVRLDAAMGPCIRDEDCPRTQVCLAGACHTPAVPCSSDDDCQDDTWCRCASGGDGGADGGEASDGGSCARRTCAPWGTDDHRYDPGCAAQGFPANAFMPPVVKCRWVDAQGGRSGVITTPLVIDLDRDHKPEIVFMIYEGNAVVAVRGDTCKEVWRTMVAGDGFAQMAAADLDHDGSPEIVAATLNALVVLGHDGRVIASAPLALGHSAAGPVIADVDGMPPAEIAIDGTVYRLVGNQLVELWRKPFTTPVYGSLDVFADMDGDGLPELVTGLEVFDGRTGADKTISSLKGLGGTYGALPAVADFNRDGKPDLALVQYVGASSQRVTVVDYAHDKVIFGPITTSTPNISNVTGGPPTIKDFDGDGVPDIAVAGYPEFIVWTPQCPLNPVPAPCPGGWLWKRKATDSSGSTGSATFDFNGDGINEIVYRDECWFHVYEGNDGKTVFAMPSSSRTGYEYPVIADTDADGHADIVVGADAVGPTNCNGGAAEGQWPMAWKGPRPEGIYVLSDPMNRWMPTRPLWSSHAYHITEIDDQLGVPLHEEPSWLRGNSYRGNAQRKAAPLGALADFTAGVATPIDNGGVSCMQSERLWANLCNRGAAGAAAGIPGTFYDRDPRGGGASALCTAVTSMPLMPGQCEVVHCDHAHPPLGPHDLWFRADDDSKDSEATSECKPANDLLFMPGYDRTIVG